jgi:hypothetical protein
MGPYIFTKVVPQQIKAFDEQVAEKDYTNLDSSINARRASYLISHSNDNGCYTWSIKYIPLSHIGCITLRAPTTGSHFRGNGIHRLQ